MTGATIRETPAHRQTHTPRRYWPALVEAERPSLLARLLDAWHTWRAS